MPCLKIHLFGYPKISIDDTLLRLERRKTLALLAYLAAGGAMPRPGAQRAQFSPSRDTLAALLWEDAGQEQAAGYLRQAIWDFHKAGGEGWIRREGATIELAGDSGIWVDVQVFEDRLNTWKAGSREGPGALSLLREAAELYRADFLAGFSLRGSAEFEAWQTLRAEGLRLALAEALEALSRLFAAQGEPAEALAAARRWLTLDELNETAQREMMRLLSENGQRNAALQQYEACRRILQEQLGAAPEPATVQLFEHISSQPTSTLAKQPVETWESAPGRTQAAPGKAQAAPVLLPAQATPFLGRKMELERIQELLAQDKCRLVTLLGPGGCGKTRLAIQAAGQSTGYPQGIYFCRLESASSEEEAVHIIAGAVRLKFRIDFRSTLKVEEAREQLLEYLAEKKILLVLDNLEQMAGHARLFSEILANAPAVKLIATSVLRLNLPEEWILEIGGLPTPEDTGNKSVWGPLNPARSDAVKLFLHGAEQACGFHPREEDWAAIARIVRLVDGLPLGIEMAAAWVRMLSCQEIAAEMERSLDFLETTRQEMPERQRSLRAVFEHSWKLLAEREGLVFQRLSIFQGGFTREAAFEVAGASLATLSGFMDQSLLLRAAAGRFDLHQIIRQYAAEKLSADPLAQADTEERCARHYAGWLLRKAGGLRSSDQVAALSTLRWERQNLRQAWRWLIEHREYSLLEHTLPDMILFFEMDGDSGTAAQMMRSAVESLRRENTSSATGKNYGLLGFLLAGIRHFERGVQDLGQADAIQRESHALAAFLPPRKTKAYIYLLLSSGPMTLDTGEVLRMCQESVAILESEHDAWGTAMATLVLGDCLNFGQSGTTLARQAYEKSLGLFTRIGNDWGRALCLFGLATLTKPEEACRMMNESIEIYLRMGNMGRVLDARHLLGDLYAQLGQIEAARECFTANQTYLDEVGAHERSNQYTEKLAWLVLKKTGNPEAG